MGLSVLALLASAAAARAAPAEDVQGDWLGTLALRPGVELRLALHVKKSPGGGYAGSVDSLDQNVFDQAAANIVEAPTGLSFDVPIFKAHFEGEWDPAAARWRGHWTQLGHTWPLDLVRGVATPAPFVRGLDGEWDGTLAMGGGLNLRLAFHIKTGSHGTLASIDSVDQGAYGTPLSAVDRHGEQVRLEMKALGAVLDGDLTDADQTIAGTFTQGGLNLPLVLKRLAPGAPPPWPAPTAPARAATPAPADWSVPADADILKLLAERIDVQHQGVGAVVGVIEPAGRRIVAYGRSDPSDPRALNGDTLFEIGSITKVFTALVLADMAAKGEVRLDDPVARYLPEGVKVPERSGREITLADLATHTSGLPRMPTNLAPKDISNPFADYSQAELYQFLSSYQLPRDPGASFEYSNLGFGLLGHVLARRAGSDYETLVKARVLGPLGMTSTGITLTPEQSARLAVGHDSSLARVGAWDLPTLAGAGALRSSANDLLTFLAACLGYADTPLKADMAALLAVRRPSASPNLIQALGWEVMGASAGEIVEHGGGTGGYHTLIAFNPRTRVGIVMLTNAETVMGADDIALHLLTGSPVATLPPPPAPPPARHVMAIDLRLLDGYVGRYRLAPEMVVVVTREGDHLFAQLTGQTRLEIFPESPNEFFWTAVDAQVTFLIAPDGRATSLVLHQYGRDLPGPRIPDIR